MSVFSRGAAVQKLLLFLVLRIMYDRFCDCGRVMCQKK